MNELAPVTVRPTPPAHHLLTLSTLPQRFAQLVISNLTAGIRSNATRPPSSALLHRQLCESYGRQSSLQLLPSFPTGIPPSDSRIIYIDSVFTARRDFKLRSSGFSQVRIDSDSFFALEAKAFRFLYRKALLGRQEIGEMKGKK